MFDFGYQIERFGPAAFAVVLAMASAGAELSAQAVEIQDLVHIRGSESMGRITGMGLVVGLNDTGDGDNSRTTIRRLTALFNNLGDPLVDPSEIDDAANVAVVYVSARIPAGGIRSGEAVDVQVSAPFAESLAGGRLVMTPLLDPVTRQNILGFAEGPVLLEDTRSPNTGVIRSGGVLNRDFRPRYVDEQGRVVLVLEQPNATWPMANLLTARINEQEGFGREGDPLAVAVDPKNIVVQVPEVERQNPGLFISRLLELSIDPSLVRTGARVVANARTGTIVFSGNVQISPVVIAHRNITITAGGQATENLASLVRGLEQLKVQPEDRVAIIQQLHRLGKLHAQLIMED